MAPFRKKILEHSNFETTFSIAKDAYGFYKKLTLTKLYLSPNSEGK